LKHFSIRISFKTTGRPEQNFFFFGGDFSTLGGTFLTKLQVDIN